MYKRTKYSLPMREIKYEKAAWEAYKRTKEIGPSKLEEIIIARTAWASYHYARYVLKGRFLAGERVIAKDIQMSHMYTKHVLKRRFVACEKMMSGCSSAYKEYLEILHENIC